MSCKSTCKRAHSSAKGIQGSGNRVKPGYGLHITAKKSEHYKAKQTLQSVLSNVLIYLMDPANMESKADIGDM